MKNSVPANLPVHNILLWMFLNLITFGIYGFFWYSRVTKAIGGSDDDKAFYKIGISVMIVAYVLSFVLGIIIVAAPNSAIAGHEIIGRIVLSVTSIAVQIILLLRLGKNLKINYPDIKLWKIFLIIPGPIYLQLKINDKYFQINGGRVQRYARIYRYYFLWCLLATPIAATIFVLSSTLTYFISKQSFFSWILSYPTIISSALLAICVFLLPIAVALAITYRIVISVEAGKNNLHISQVLSSMQNGSGKARRGTWMFSTIALIGVVVFALLQFIAIVGSVGYAAYRYSTTNESGYVGKTFASIEEALDEFYDGIVHKTYEYGEIPVTSKSIFYNSQDTKVYWYIVKNPSNKVIDRGIVKTKPSDKVRNVRVVYSREQLEQNSAKLKELLSSLDAGVVNTKVLADDGKGSGSFREAEKHRTAGTRAINRSDHGTAQDELMKALELVGTDNVEYRARILSNLGLLYNNQEQDDKRDAFYQQAVDILDERYFNFFTYKAILAKYKNRPAEAVALYKKALKMHPNDFDALHHLGGLLVYDDTNSDNCKNALQYNEKAYQINPGVYNVLAYNYLCLEQYDQAISLVEKSLNTQSAAGHEYGYTYLAIANIEKSDFSNALKAYNNVLALDPTLKNQWIEETLCKELKEYCK